MLRPRGQSFGATPGRATTKEPRDADETQGQVMVKVPVQPWVHLAVEVPHEKTVSSRFLQLCSMLESLHRRVVLLSILHGGLTNTEPPLVLQWKASPQVG